MRPAGFRRLLVAVEESFIVPTRVSPRAGVWQAAHAGFALPLQIRGPVRRHRARVDGEEVRILCAGGEKRTRGLVDHLFGQIEPVGEAKAGWLWRPTPPADVDLALVAVHRWLAPRFRRAGWRIIPGMVRWCGDLDSIPPAPPSESLRQDLKKVRRGDYTLEVGGTAADWAIFVDEMLLPTAVGRFGARAWIPSRRVLRAFRSAGSLLFLRDGGRRVAGECVIPSGRTLWSPIVGVLAGDRELVRRGAMAALYGLTFDWARSQGFDRVDWGRTQPYADGGIPRFKRKWGLAPASDSLAHRVALWARPGCEGVRRALDRAAVYEEAADGIRVLAS